MGKQRVVGFYESTANRILNRLGVGSEVEFVERKRGRAGGAIRYAVLASDSVATDTTVLAWPGKLSASYKIERDPGAGDVPLEIINLDEVFTSPKQARAGYGFMYFSDAEGHLSPIAQRCIEPCVGNGGTITLPAFPAANEGDPINLTITTGGGGPITNLAIAPLPDGLTFDNALKTITGTLAIGSAGTYHMIVTGSAGDCTITKLVKWTISE